MSYVLDVMQIYELDLILESLEMSVKQPWEMIRSVCFSVTQANSRKKLKPTDVMKFSWEKDQKQNTISTEDIQRLFKKANKILKDGRFSN